MKFTSGKVFRIFHPGVGIALGSWQKGVASKVGGGQEGTEWCARAVNAGEVGHDQEHTCGCSRLTVVAVVRRNSMRHRRRLSSVETV